MRVTAVVATIMVSGQLTRRGVDSALDLYRLTTSFYVLAGA